MPASLARAATASISRSDSSTERLMFRLLCVSLADTTVASSSARAAMAFRAPTAFGTRATYVTPSRRGIAANTSAASRIWGIAFGLTNDPASIRLKPASPSRAISSTFCGVSMYRSSFWSPSRGPTSVIVTRSGSVAMPMPPRSRSRRGQRLAPPWRPAGRRCSSQRRRAVIR